MPLLDPPSGGLFPEDSDLPPPTSLAKHSVESDNESAASNAEIYGASSKQKWINNSTPQLLI